TLPAAIVDLIGAHPSAQFSQKAIMTNCLAQLHSFERHGCLIYLVCFHLELRFRIGPQTGMSVGVEAYPLISPSPPFHVLRRVHMSLRCADRSGVHEPAPARASIPHSLRRKSSH